MELSPREGRILVQLARRAGRVVSRASLEEGAFDLGEGAGEQRPSRCTSTTCAASWGRPASAPSGAWATSWSRREAEAVKRSLLRRMILAQAAGLGFLWLLLTAVNVGTGLPGQAGGLRCEPPPDGRSPRGLPGGRGGPPGGSGSRPSGSLPWTRPTPRSRGSPRGEYRSHIQVLDREGRLLYRSPAAPLRPFTSEGPGFHQVGPGRTGWRVLVQDGRGGRIRVEVAESPGHAPTLPVAIPLDVPHPHAHPLRPHRPLHLGGCPGGRCAP